MTMTGDRKQSRHVMLHVLQESTDTAILLIRAKYLTGNRVIMPKHLIIINQSDIL